MSGALAVKSDSVTAYRRDYEERARELGEEAADDDAMTDATSTLFTDAAANTAASAKVNTHDRAEPLSPTPEGVETDTPREAKPRSADLRAQAVMQGYTGNECLECHNFTMVRNGTCEKCDTCGATSGCS
jgi:ribonucleoside-diphosphate reductase alpha chain